MESVWCKKKKCEAEITKILLLDSLASQVLVRGIFSEVNLFHLDSQAN